MICYDIHPFNFFVLNFQRGLKQENENWPYLTYT